MEGLVRYEDGLRLQEEAFQAVQQEKYDGVLILLEHHPVYTIGTGGGLENLLCSQESLEAEGVDLIKINRGGNITFHGPGQIVAYPIFDLNKLRKDSHWYISSLEETVMRVLATYGIQGSRKPEYRGVWIGNEKISAVGVHVKRWITTHGLSFNICLDKNYFYRINPCGITEFGITSLEDHVAGAEMTVIREKLVQSFQEVFGITLEPEA
jgi:lipoyl(octanoyl) transferase